ncbi:MAG TPA: PDZ domain-containing protein [Acidobacteriota bacterium]|nr:PDZ domain-containing protein [Acidobacteriota bacterium]
MNRFFLALVLILIAAATTWGQTNPPLLMRSPTVSRTQVVFVFAGDLWTVSREGGEATRLTTGVGTETTPLFSPDGQWVAFTGEYDGNLDVFVVSAKGGVPKRITYHPANDILAGWTPDGKNLLISSDRNTINGRTNQLYTIPVDGVTPTLIPLPMAFEGSFSADGSQLAYVPVPRAFRAWKRYRGGLAAYIWIANLADSSVVKLPRENSNDFNPMWIGDKIYFLSDRNGPVTLFSYDLKTKKVTQEIQNSGLDFKAASAGPDVIVYEQFGSLHYFDLQTGKTRPMNVTIAGDFLAVRPKFEKVANSILNLGISPTGARAVVEARGEILTIPGEKGDVRNLTNTTGVAERDPSWSPDGKWIAYFSDESGEYALHLRTQTGMGEVKKINLGTPSSFFYTPVWSPDSKKIAFCDKRLNFWYVEVEKGTPVKIDNFERGLVTNYKWSPDSQWLTYAKPLKSVYNAVFVYSLADGKLTQITDGMSNAASPAFDRNGKYLYFTASTNSGPQMFGFDMSSYPHQPTSSVYVCVLKKDEASPLAPESDEEKPEGAAKDGEKKPGEADKGTGKPDEKKEPPKVTIDVEKINQRILALPIPARNFIDLFTGKDNLVYLAEFSTDVQSPGITLHKFDMQKRKLDKVLDGVTGWTLSANGEKLLYGQGPAWFIAAIDQPIKPGEGKLKTEDLTVYVDPRAEWNQMYRETWRIERDFFYDPNYHGLDIKATEKKYQPYVNGLVHRADLNYLFQEMLGELTVGHLYVSGGDTPDPKRVPGGLLGADYTIENGRYRFARVFDGENWNPQLKAPLTQPGVNVVAGEYLLAVNGRELTAKDNVYGFFESTAGKQVVIKVGPNPDGTGAREVTVVPVDSEDGLRNLAWVEDNRRKVDQLSGGKLAYVYLPDTAQGGYTYFNRYFFSQLEKDGAVIDDRYNRGGHAADYIVDYLRKPLMSLWTSRDAKDFRQPFGTMEGPKVMLTNEYSGSGGDYLPWMFHRLKIGPLMGKRTWGGLVGIGGYPVLMDGGSVTAPHFAFYTPEGQWEVENHGVAPDVEIELDPKLWRQGRDLQLEKAVEWLLAELKKNPPKEYRRPAYPNYHKK